MCFDRTFPAGFVTEVARRLDTGGADALWVIEDCFYTTAVSLAAASLAVTERLSVGLGILPSVVRNPAMTAMEIATLCGLGPGRVLPGIGHGVQHWMGQIGARQRSPMTALDEVVTAVKRLLGGEQVTVDGSFVRLRDVQLAAPPADPPPVLVGVQGKKSMGVAGRVADGLILAEPATPADVRAGLAAAGRTTRAADPDSTDDFTLVAFSNLCVRADRRDARREMAPWLGSILDQQRPALSDWPFIDDLRALYRADGVDGLAGMPDDWWGQVGPIGTLDDALAHVDALRAAGATAVAFFPPADVDIARRQLDDVLAVVSASAR